jgi:hypothetical protein
VSNPEIDWSKQSFNGIDSSHTEHVQRSEVFIFKHCTFLKCIQARHPVKKPAVQPHLSSSSMSQFIVFRFFMGCKLSVGELQVWRSTDELVGFGGAPAVLGGGTIADLMSQEQRGTAMDVWLMGPSQ